MVHCLLRERRNAPDGFSGRRLRLSHGAYRARRPVVDPDLGLVSFVTVTRDRLKDLQVGIEDRPGDVRVTPARSGNGGLAGPGWH